ncbi:MAG: hypothetical protein R3210_06685 [Roseovarius sp.]|nr:hypothetical protein [Roseovarius sp.]
MFRTYISALIMFVASATTLSAATYNVFGSFSGGQLGFVKFDFSVTGDFSTDIPETDTGLIINSITSTVVGGDPFPVGGGYGFRYYSTQDMLVFGGRASGVGGISSPYTDFGLLIEDLSAKPWISKVVDSLDSESGNAFPNIDTGTVTLAPVPLPAGLPLLLSGLVGMAGLRMRKRKVTKS